MSNALAKALAWPEVMMVVNKRTGTLSCLGIVILGAGVLLLTGYSAAYALWMTAYPMVNNSLWASRFFGLAVAFLLELLLVFLLIIRFVLGYRGSAADR